MERKALGTLIVFEGLDGSGKTTAMQNLASVLREDGHDVVIASSPCNESALGVNVRKLSHMPVIHEEAKILLYLADMVNQQNNVIRPGLAAGKIILMDRWWFSTLVYNQSEKIPTQAIMNLVRATGLCKPDLSVFLDVPYEVSRERLDARGFTNILDDMPADLFNYRREQYKNIIEHYRGVCIDATGDVDSVFNLLCNNIYCFLESSKVFDSERNRNTD